MISYINYKIVFFSIFFVNVNEDPTPFFTYYTPSDINKQGE